MTISGISLWSKERVTRPKIVFNGYIGKTKNGSSSSIMQMTRHSTFSTTSHAVPTSNGNILVTTRNNESRIHAPRSNLKISGLTLDDAKDLLLEVSGLGEPSDETILSARIIVKASQPAHLHLTIRLTIWGRNRVTSHLR
jgi:hypothetical protein